MPNLINNATKPKNRLGFAVINKPAGMSSGDVCRIFRKSGIKQVGHVGTLDPAATGALPILVGKATRLQDYLHLFPKKYAFDLKLGVTSDTLDADSPVTQTLPVPEITFAQIQSVLQPFMGKIVQKAPSYSAIKYNGKPLYSYAREGRLAEVPDEVYYRNVEIFSFEYISRQENVLKFVVSCSSGTYVRSLGRDIALNLGTCGLVAAIHRLETSGFDLIGSYSVDKIKAAPGVDECITPIEELNSINKIQFNQAADVAYLTDGKQIDCAWAAVNCKIEVDDVENVHLLIDTEGQCFGIGKLIDRSDLGFKVKMTRGLL